MPTVILPWHPGHGRATRIVPEPEEFAALMKDLENARWLGEVGAVLSGYLGDAGQADGSCFAGQGGQGEEPARRYLSATR